MKSFNYLVLTAAAALSICQGTAAQQVYRCGNSYSQTPCTGAVAINTDDARTPEQRAQAKQALASDKALAKDLEATRRKDAALALAADKLALSRAEAAHKKEEKKPVIKKESSAGKTRKAQAKPAEFFTATDGAPKKKAARKAAKP